MSKKKADNINKDYEDKLFGAAALILPSVILRSADHVSPAELVDNAVLLARDLLAELGYVYRSGGTRNGE